MGGTSDPGPSVRVRPSGGREFKCGAVLTWCAQSKAGRTDAATLCPTAATASLSWPPALRVWGLLTRVIARRLSP